MSRKVPVILLEDVGSLGRAGDIITVSEGYARNFLFPQGKAALADEAAVKKVESQRAAAKAEKEKDLAESQAQAEALDGTELTLTAKLKKVAGPEKSEADLGASNEIFGSLTARHIAEALKKQAKLDVKPKDIVLEKPITELGSYDVTVKLSPDAEATIKVTVNAET